MRLITWNTFRSELRQWFDNRFSSIPDYSLPFFSQGGWEVWLQVELAMYFAASDYDIMREVKYDNQDLRADFVLNRNFYDRREIFVEIKCQSIYIDKYSMYNYISRDEQKMTQDLNDTQKGVMIVVVVEPTLAVTLEKYGYTEIKLIQNNIKIYSKIVKG